MLLTLIAIHQPPVSLLNLFLCLTIMVSMFLYLASAAQLNAYSQFKPGTLWLGPVVAGLQHLSKRGPYINLTSRWLYLHLYEPVLDTYSRTSLNSLNTAVWSLQLFGSPSVTSAYIDKITAWYAVREVILISKIWIKELVFPNARCQGKLKALCIGNKICYIVETQTKHILHFCFWHSVLTITEG